MLEIDGARAVRFTLALAVGLAVACGGGDNSSRSAGAEEPAGESSGLPVSAPEGPVDTELAATGEELFRTRGCVACHKVGGGRLVGPDLEGVTERRSFEWTYHMVTNPDSMLKNDSIAGELLQEYFTPMSDQNVQPDQFMAIYEYLRSASR